MKVKKKKRMKEEENEEEGVKDVPSESAHGIGEVEELLRTRGRPGEFQHEVFILSFILCCFVLFLVPGRMWKSLGRAFCFLALSAVSAHTFLFSLILQDI